jgi:hypothetical protein
MDVRRFLIVSGLAVLAAGICWPWLSRLGLGRLPGDIVIDRPTVRIYMPIVSCLLVSIVLTLLFWLTRK